MFMFEPGYGTVKGTATNLLILLTLPEAVRARYYEHVRTRFPDLVVNMVDHHSKVDPYIGAADILVTFGPMMADRVLQAATRLKRIQALGTGVDGIVDQPSLRDDVLITNLHGIHGAPVSEATRLEVKVVNLWSTGRSGTSSWRRTATATQAAI